MSDPATLADMRTNRAHIATLTGLRDDLLDQIDEVQTKFDAAIASRGWDPKNPPSTLLNAEAGYWSDKRDELRGRLAKIESRIRGEAQRGTAADLREHLVRGDSTMLELPVERRDLARPSGVSAGSDSFVEGLFGALVDVVPLLELATIVTTANGGDLEFDYIASQPTVAGIVAEGTTITGTDPTFGEVAFGAPFKYPANIKFSAELVEDWRFDLEGYITARVVPTLQRKLADNLWRGAGGTTAPQGLATAATTVTAAGASTVTFADIETLIAAVPANYRHGGGAALVMHPAAYLALRNQKASTGGSYMWDPTRGDTLFGFPVRVDNALAAPATTARSVVFGDFSQAYAIRLLPVRFATSDQQAFASGLVNAQVVIRADGRTMNTGAVRALVHP